MITTGIIREINISSDQDHQSNLYGVEVSIFKSPINKNNKNEYIIKCTACLPGGIYSPYNIGDAVYISFINNNFSNAVILGKIYKGIKNYECESYSHIVDLNVKNSAIFSSDIKIGDIDYADLANTLNTCNHLNKAQENELIIGSSSHTPIPSGVYANKLTLYDSIALHENNIISYPTTGETWAITLKSNINEEKIFIDDSYDTVSIDFSDFDLQYQLPYKVFFKRNSTIINNDKKYYQFSAINNSYTFESDKISISKIGNIDLLFLDDYNPYNLRIYITRK